MVYLRGGAKILSKSPRPHLRIWHVTTLIAPNLQAPYCAWYSVDFSSSAKRQFPGVNVNSLLLCALSTQRMDNSIHEFITGHARIKKRSFWVKKAVDVAMRFIAEKTGVLKKVQSELNIPREWEIPRVPRGRGTAEWIAEESPAGSIVIVSQRGLSETFQHCTRRENDTALA